MDKSNLAVGIALVATVIALLAFFHLSPASFGAVQSTTDTTTTNLTTGSFANGFQVGGVFITASPRQALVSASTTPCAIQSPNATSTIVNFVMNITTATSTAVTFAIGTSTTAFATSTNLVAIAAIGSGLQTTLGFAQNATQLGVIAPSTWIVAGNAQGQVFYPFAVGGTCQAIFEIAS